MQNMGIEVLFKGINSLRLWQGLWVTIRIALISMVFSIVLGFLLGMVMNIPNKINRMRRDFIVDFFIIYLC